VTTTDVAPRNADAPQSGGASRLWNRQLPHYPNTGPRSVYLGITVLATIVLYYELYIAGAVATQIIAEFNMSFTFFVVVSVIGNLVGAFASLFAGLADRWGRANLVVWGLLLTGAIIAFGLPNAPNKTVYTVLFAVLSFVEGIVLVATPALIRDFSPQVGRGAAMGFWTLGPVLGSLVVTTVSSNTLDSHPDWRFQFYVCGIAGLVVFVVAFLGLRELSPRLRDQLMVTMRDRALIEARAKGIDPEQATKGAWRSMMRFDVIGSAFAISVFLLLYYALVGFIVVYFATAHGYSEQKANGLANWYWGFNAIGLVVFGLLSDKLRVRKPFMILGTAISLVGGILFAISSTDASTGYYQFALYFVLSSVGGGMAYVAWMASFTETVEKHNPAATATGLAVWGWLLRLVVCVSLIALTFVVPATSILVDQGPRVATLAEQYKAELATLAKVDPATQKALAANSDDQQAQAQALSDISGVPVADVAKTVQLSQQYQTQLATLAKIKPATQQALAANPADQQAQAQAVSDISGVPVADVVKASTLSQQYAQELQTAGAVDQATLLTLASNPTDAAAGAKAVGEISQALGVSPAVAQQRLVALGAVPKEDITFLLTTGPQIQSAAADLTAVSQVPAADLTFLAANGPKVQAAGADLTAVSKVPADDLNFLSANGTKVQQAQKDNPNQWQTWWWVCIAGQIVFLPFVFVMTGRWSPRKAREDEQAHEEMVQRELAALESARSEA
jgi:MFS family permease